MPLINATPYWQRVGKASELPLKNERRRYRFYEMLPGVLAWATLILVISLSFLLPVYISIFIIIFDVYWLVKTIYLSLHLRVAFAQVRRNMRIDWGKRLKELPPEKYTLKIKSWEDIYHLILLPSYREDKEVVEAAIEGLVNANYSKTKMIVILAQEERAGEAFNKGIGEYFKSKYKNQFLDFIVTKHPGDIAGEVAGKGSNIAWAAKQVKRDIIDARGIPYRQLLVSALDIDTVVPPHYFSRLTHAYLTAKDPLRASYQPVPFYTNNIWEAPTFARVVAFAATIWHTIQQERVEGATTFSSHSMPFQALADIDFWQTNMVNEDSRVFWQCFLRYHGGYRVEPLHFPVSMDANVAPTFWKTIANVYRQQRRWGYGAENIPYFLFGFHKDKLIPLRKKLFYIFRILEGFWSWATNALIIFMLGWLPVMVGGVKFNQTVLSFNLPYFTRMVMSFAMLGLVTSAVISIFILPPRPPRFGKFKHVWMVLQWALFPITTVFLGALPGLEAQTRLMIGKYMGFWVTPKYRRNTGSPKNMPQKETETTLDSTVRGVL